MPTAYIATASRSSPSRPQSLYVLAIVIVVAVAVVVAVVVVVGSYVSGTIKCRAFPSRGLIHIGHVLQGPYSIRASLDGAFP